MIRKSAHRGIGRRLLAAAVSFSLACSLLLALSAPLLAAPGTRVNAEPELASANAGTTITLTASVTDSHGDPAVGSDSNTHVRWYFTDDSPNSQGNNPDLQCWTATAGSCSVSYLASAVGIDSVCAIVGASLFTCDEAQAAPEWDNHADAVIVTISQGPFPMPDLTPILTPMPDLTPILTRTPDPTPTPTPTATPDPTPTPTPTPAPDVLPIPIPTPDLVPIPTPDLVPIPTPDLVPVATPDPTPTPSEKVVPPLSPSPSADPADRRPEPVVPALPADGSPEPIADPSVPASISAPEPRMATAPIGRLGPAPPPPDAPVPSLPAAPASAPIGLIAQVVAAAVGGVTTVLRPEAVIGVAGEFTFPIALAIAVVAYLGVQGRIDRRDPKLRLAPQHMTETIVRFEPEAAL